MSVLGDEGIDVEDSLLQLSEEDGQDDNIVKCETAIR